MKILKKLSVFLLICVLTMGTTEVGAVKYAYSIGTNWGTSGALVGDYTDNVITALTYYDYINNVSSCYNVRPTPAYIRSNNPNGNRIIASKIVFFNGHASAKRILFNHQYNASYMTGVCAGVDKVDDGYTFAGLSSTDMSSCNLANFFGCSTAFIDTTDYNLIEKAVARGANTAVGFKGTIYSLYASGQGWIETYHYNLACGKSVSQSISAAVAAYPNDAMSSQVQIAGDPTKSFNTGGLYSLERNVGKYSDSPSFNLEDQLDINGEVFNNDYLKENIEEIDPTINWEDYVVDVNMYCPEYGYGCVVFSYVIDDEIETNKAYICTLENNKLVDITYSLEDDGVAAASVDVTMSEAEMISKVNVHKSNKAAKVSVASLVNLEEYKEVYYYDYKTNELTYREYTAINDPELDVIIAECEDEEL